MRELKERVGLAWLTPTYFLHGWEFFFKEETTIICVYIVLALGLSALSGCFSIWCLCQFTLAIILLRRILAGGICNSTKRLDGKIVVITGANVGIGKETAKDLLLRGAEIVMACRNLDKATQTANELRSLCGGNISAMQCDLSSFESIRSFSREFAINFKKIDILINNAGVMMCPESKTADGLELQYGTNHFGHFLLTSLLMPYLQKASSARIINVSSLGHWMAKMNLDDINYSKGYDRMVAYANSKLANILFTIGLNKRFAGSKIEAFALHPGTVQSDLGRHLPFGLSVFHSNWIKLIYKTTAEGAQTSIYCATDATLCQHAYYSDCEPANSSDDSRNMALSDQLWKVSEDICKIQLKS